MTSISITSYIVGLSPDIRSQLYSSEWTCQALFRALPPLAQQYVLRLLYVDRPVGEGELHRMADARIDRKSVV